MNKEIILVKEPSIEAVNMGDELAMLNVKTSKYVVLNDVGKDIWELIDGKKNIQTIIDDLLIIYDVSEEECREAVFEFTDKLLDNQLVSGL